MSLLEILFFCVSRGRRSGIEVGICVIKGLFWSNRAWKSWILVVMSRQQAAKIPLKMVPRVKKTIILGTLDCQINDISAGEQSKIDSLLIHFGFKIQYFYILAMLTGFVQKTRLLLILFSDGCSKSFSGTIMGH